MSVPFLEALVDIKADISRLRKDFNTAEQAAKDSTEKMESSFKKVDNSVSTVGNNLRSLRAGFSSLLALAGIGGFTAFTRELIAVADALDAASNRLGVNVEALQREKFMAEQLGVSFGELEVGLKEFLRRLGDISTKGKSDLSPVLQRLGIEINELGTGVQRDGIAIFDDFIDKLSGVENASERLSLAQQAAGRSGAAFAQIANNTSEAIAELRENAPIFSETQIQALDEAGDAWDRIKQTIQVIAGSGFIQVYDALFGVSASTKVGMLTEKIGGFNREIERLSLLNPGDKEGGIFGLLTNTNAEQIEALKGTVATLTMLRDKLARDVPQKDDAKGAKPLIPLITEEELKRQQDLMDQLKRQALDSANNRIALAEQVRTETMKAIDETVKEEGKALEARRLANEIYANTVKKIHRDIADAEADALKEIRKENEKIIADMERAMQQTAREVDRLADQISSAVADVAIGGREAFEDFLRYLEREFITEAIKQLIGLALAKKAIGEAGMTPDAGGGAGKTNLGAAAAKALIGGAVTGFGALFKGFFAKGGDLPPGKLGFAGENGIELISGGSSGKRITPMNAGGTTLRSNVSVQVFNTTGEPVRVEPKGMINGAQLVKVFLGAVQADIANNGPVGRQFTQTFGVRPRLGV